MGRHELKVGSVGVALENLSKGESGKAFFPDAGESTIQALGDIRQGYELIVIDAHQGVVEYVRPHSESYLYHDYVALVAAQAQANPYEVGQSQRNVNDNKKLFISESTLFYNATGAVTVRFNEWDSLAIAIPANFPITFNTRISKFWVITIAAGTLNVWMEGNQ